MQKNYGLDGCKQWLQLFSNTADLSVDCVKDPDDPWCLLHWCYIDPTSCVEQTADCSDAGGKLGSDTQGLCRYFDAKGLRRCMLP